MLSVLFSSIWLINKERKVKIQEEMKMINFLPILLVLLRVSQAGINIGSPFEFCPLSGQHYYDLADKTATNPTFNWTSTYSADPNKESSSLLISTGDGINDFICRIYGSTGIIASQQSCLGTKFFTYIGLINNFLFLVDTAFDRYYACKFDTSGVSSVNPYELESLTWPFVVQNFVPYMVADPKIYFLASSKTYSRVVEYTWAAGSMAGVMAVGPTASQYSQAIGTQSLLYDQSTQKFMVPSADKLSWVETSLPPNPLATQKVIGYSLRNKNTIIVVASSSMTSSSVYHAIGSSCVNTGFSNSVSTFTILFFCDYLYNHFRVHSDSFSWITLSTNNPGTAYYTTFDNPNKGTVLSVGLSQNKAIVFYSTGEIQFYRHESSGTATRFTGMTVSSAIDWASTKQYVLTATCMCENIKKSNCFSRTLSCIITTKTISECTRIYSSSSSW